MALIQCPECGGKVSDQAAVCIHCGYPIREKLAKKIRCPYCGEPMDPDQTTCPACGFIKKSVSKNKKDTDEKENRNETEAENNDDQNEKTQEDPDSVKNHSTQCKAGPEEYLLTLETGTTAPAHEKTTMPVQEKNLTELVSCLQKEHSAFGQAYDVRLQNRMCRVPQYCINCLRPTDSARTYGGGVRLPVCSVCMKEQRDHTEKSDEDPELSKRLASDKAKRRITIGTVAGIAAGWLAGLITLGASGRLVPALLLSMVVSVLVFAGFCASPISYDPPSSETQKLTILSASVRPDGPGTMFTFTSFAYAKLFAYVNGTETAISDVNLITEKMKEYSFRLYKRSWKLLISTAAVSVMLFVIIALFRMVL